MKSIVEILEGVFPKCSKLDIKTEGELLEILSVMGLLNVKKISERIFDADPDSFVDFILNLKMFGLDSKSEIRKLMKNNGIKVNNKPPVEKLSEIQWIKLGDIEFAVIKKGKNDFDFLFNQFQLG